MGHNLLLSLFIWMLKISQLWPVKVLSIWLVSFWHAHRPCHSLSTSWISVESSSIFQTLAEVSSSPGVSSFLWLTMVFGYQDPGAPKRVPFPAYLGPDTLHWPPRPPIPTPHYTTVDLAWPYLLASDHIVGGRTEEEEKLIYFFNLELSRL